MIWLLFSAKWLNFAWLPPVIAGSSYSSSSTGNYLCYGKNLLQEYKNLYLKSSFEQWTLARASQYFDDIV